MITPEEIVSKCKRLYPDAMDAWVNQVIGYFPRRIPVNLELPKGHAAALAAIDLLRRESKEFQQFGYRVVWRQVKSRTYGNNFQPKEVWIDSVDDLITLVQKQREFQSLVRNVGLLRDRLPELDQWVRRKWKDLVHVEDLKSLITVCDYIRLNPRPNCFVRELPVPISTKLIEEHVRLLSSWLDLLLPAESIDATVDWRDFERRYGFKYYENHLRVRALDAEVAKQLRFPFQEISLPVASIAKLAPKGICVVIVENKATLESLPCIPYCLAMGGLGFGVRELSEVAWLREVPVYYWGDIDSQGYQILSLLRLDLPQLHSVLMDLQTLDRYRELAITGTGTIDQVPLGLTAEERAACDSCVKENLRIEQEKIPVNCLVEFLSTMRNLDRQ